MVLHSQTRVVRGESAVLAAKENIKTVLMEQTSGRKLTCTKKFLVGVLKSTLQTSTQWEQQTAECILHEGERSGVLWGTLSKAQMDSQPDVNLLKYLQQRLCLITFIIDYDWSGYFCA